MKKIIIQKRIDSYGGFVVLTIDTKKIEIKKIEFK